MEEEEKEKKENGRRWNTVKKTIKTMERNMEVEHNSGEVRDVEKEGKGGT